MATYLPAFCHLMFEIAGVSRVAKPAGHWKWLDILIAQRLTQTIPFALKQAVVACI
jgi:hypothetical protein